MRGGQALHLVLPVVIGLTALVGLPLELKAAPHSELWKQHHRPINPQNDRRDQLPRLACSFQHPLCIHGDPGLSSSEVARALRVAEVARSGLTLLGLPQTLFDGGRGGSLDHDIYLVPGTQDAASYSDPPDVQMAFDHTSTYTLGPDPSRMDECAFASALTRALAQAVLLGIDPATHDGSLAMLSSYFATVLSPCTAVEAEALDVFQRHPERPITDADPAGFNGAFLFPWYLDAAYGSGPPGTVMTALLAVSTQQTAPQSEHWHNEPDLFDALRHATRDRGFTIGELVLDFTVARAFLGDREDGAHLSGTTHFDYFGRPRFEWALDFSSLPRRVAPRYPVYPTGASFLWLDLTGAHPTDGLRIAFEWEQGSVFQWAAVKLDAKGHEIGRSITPGMFGQLNAQLSIVDLRDTSALLIAGTNLGSDDRSRPFDPDEGDPRPASYVVTVERL